MQALITHRSYPSEPSGDTYTVQTGDHASKSFVSSRARSRMWLARFTGGSSIKMSTEEAPFCSVSLRPFDGGFDGLLIDPTALLKEPSNEPATGIPQTAHSGTSHTSFSDYVSIKNQSTRQGTHNQGQTHVQRGRVWSCLYCFLMGLGFVRKRRSQRKSRFESGGTLLLLID